MPDIREAMGRVACWLATDEAVAGGSYHTAGLADDARALLVYIDRLDDMVQAVEWVRQAGGSKYACPWCYAISERDGGPGHQDYCPWVVLIERGGLDA